MAGRGDRFVAKGYRSPKPLIQLNDGRMIIEHVLDMFQDPDDKFIFICNDEHLSTTGMADILEELRPDCQIVAIPPHKKGPVYTLLPAFDLIDHDEEIVVAYCDGTVKWNRQDFNLSMAEADGALITHTGFHPHTLSSTKMAFIKEDRGQVLEVKEKACYTDDPFSEHASSGIYYFKKGSYLKKYCQQLIDLNLNYNGEFYVTLVYNLLIQDGLRVKYYDTDYVAILGTPEDTSNFEAWATLVKNMPTVSDDDLMECFYYWRGYYK